MKYNLYRCIITSERKNFYFAKMISGERVKIEKNEYTSKFSVKDDRYFYAYEKGKSLINVSTLVPIDYEKYTDLMENKNITIDKDEWNSLKEKGSDQN